MNAAAARLTGATALPSPGRAALAVAIAACAILAGALFIEHGLGVKPCELCLQQRIPYYLGVPLASLAAWQGLRRPSGLAATLLLALLAALFLAGAVLGAYHAGVEWGVWPGPSACTGAAARPAGMGDFLHALERTKVVRCDEVSFRILGLSLAAWNTLLSLGLAALAGAGALRSRAA